MRSDRDAQSVARDSILTMQLPDLVSVVSVVSVVGVVSAVEVRPIDSFRLDVVGEGSKTSRNR
jgi:hypothetical protein